MALQVQERTTIRKVDYNLGLVILALNLIGLINLYSATHGPNSHNVNQLMWSQLIYLAAGWVIYAGVTFIDYRIFIRLAYVLYGINVCLLFLVLVIGHTTLGAQRWLNLGFFHYQPSESMKLVMVIVIARYFHTHVRPQGHTVRELIVPLILVLIPSAFVIKQPDLGTGLLLVTVIASMLLFVRIQRKVLVITVIVTFLALPLAWKFAFKEYQKNRVLTFLDPNRDPRGAGYNSIQSKIAVGSGPLAWRWSALGLEPKELVMALSAGELLRGRREPYWYGGDSLPERVPCSASQSLSGRFLSKWQRRLCLHERHLRTPERPSDLIVH